MSEDERPLSETLTDAQIAEVLKEHNLEGTAENIDFVRSTRKIVEKYLKQLDRGRPFAEILTEVRINSLHKN
ncbi:MAG: hypothetical protein UR39_C0003G0091 [Candidatus Woesebacteria bacterium GW2011_GWA1_33_30]|uniref:Uncharacterized protein n=1 Tax=Candidatus Woesebacteria bacterium GW2011_GWA2_33_28 TaxID=1618561 RepID=A0A0F9ZTT3_9BACT|nr:MAG: hypothetical protein UR38_C0003G0094 [Candidatus Woesebacteria bacterium GW2011_GWA2_33_28]KKP48556.1 MAG: hypothetical protein UR39_C0003G0091 [Candidatus Woesebacteria bacterium GW2011_GWA1_33_30]KKP49695.1 MAG: hypothetical protein UR40_C0004G0094 [Microgenomates group bacterium GW2011_GWC1_33_32]KKP52312.1 MAG: hypothetical protein UR44_C0003G0094 [Candidatus Woesebacteria bacterium GW2011_GWB1_33_38]KKP56071.1 MAG: hypothetical protein UR48_C0041G0006 [Microgenomates group bacteriu